MSISDSFPSRSDWVVVKTKMRCPEYGNCLWGTRREVIRVLLTDLCFYLEQGEYLEPTSSEKKRGWPEQRLNWIKDNHMILEEILTVPALVSIINDIVRTDPDKYIVVLNGDDDHVKVRY